MSTLKNMLFIRDQRMAERAAESKKVMDVFVRRDIPLSRMKTTAMDHLSVPVANKNRRGAFV